ncbi:ribonuclease III [Patescibacteria group bacterium]|nr:MAG: ribonuclease III [Patescibacteria group bacterium]
MATTDISVFEKKAGVTFKDKALLTQAFTHRSYLNENKGLKMSHNERLEFLGDAVLELISTDYLFKKYPDKTEGDLTSYRSALVNTHSLAKAAINLDINDYLLLSKGEAKDMGRARQIILADTFEAVLGALYVDAGYESARDFVKRNLFDLIDIAHIVKNKLWLDAKSRFQEQAQEKLGVTPAYKTIREEGPDHDKVFTLGVFLGDVQVATGEGPSKQEAEQKAAENGLKEKSW